jgi:hypothetical protein
MLLQSGGWKGAALATLALVPRGPGSVTLNLGGCEKSVVIGIGHSEASPENLGWQVAVGIGGNELLLCHGLRRKVAADPRIVPAAGVLLEEADTGLDAVALAKGQGKSTGQCKSA